LIHALSVSYCASLLLGKSEGEMNEIKKIMTPKLKRGYVDYEKYYEELKKN